MSRSRTAREFAALAVVGVAAISACLPTTHHTFRTGGIHRPSPDVSAVVHVVPTNAPRTMPPVTGNPYSIIILWSATATEVAQVHVDSVRFEDADGRVAHIALPRRTQIDPNREGGWITELPPQELEFREHRIRIYFRRTLRGEEVHAELVVTMVPHRSRDWTVSIV